MFVYAQIPEVFITMTQLETNNKTKEHHTHPGTLELWSMILTQEEVGYWTIIYETFYYDKK